MNIEEKTVLVTGGGSGIGAGIAEAFAEKGAKVAITDINLDHAEAEAARIGHSTIAVKHDVASLESWSDVKTAVESQLGTVDILCNNAGVSLPFKSLEDVAPEEFDRVIAVNLRGVYNGCITFIPDMKAQGSGHIVNTSSVNGLLPHGPYATYCASKFAVTGFSESLRIDLESSGVGVSILYPGLTRSRMSEEQVPGMTAEQRKVLSANMMEPIWLGRAVVKAVESNELHIISHPEFLPVIKARNETLYAAHGDPAQPGYVPGSFSAE